jgi:predicted MPP superfamily phosphohydrolase
VSHVDLRGQGSWPTAAPLRIVHLSDIHIGQNLSVDQIRSFVRRANDLDGDLICITGDIIDAPHVDYATYLPILAELRARAGVVAILGNHDHRAGAPDVVAALQSWTSFHVLRDEAVTLDIGETAVHVIGLDDRGRDWARGVMSDARLAELVGVAPAGVPILLLAHRPDVFPQAAAHGIALTLSGHTHGGQLALPWFGGRRPNLAEFITDFSRGLYERDGHFLYVSCGIGVTAQPIRLFTPREIALIEVTARRDAPASAHVLT